MVYDGDFDDFLMATDDSIDYVPNLKVCSGA